MLSYQDCLHFSDLKPEEIRAIAEHEGVPEIVAVQLGAELLKSAEGVRTIQHMMLENVQRARSDGRLAKVDRLASDYSRFSARRL